MYLPHHDELIGPDRAVLKEALLRYAREGLTLAQRVAATNADLGYSIGYDRLYLPYETLPKHETSIFYLFRLTKLKKWNKEFNIQSTRKPPPLETATQYILDEVEKDITQGNGPTFVKSRLKDKDIAIPRCVVSVITQLKFS